MTHTPFPAATIVGYPRVGRFRELKKAQEAFWKGKITQDELRQAAADVQRTYYDRVIERGLSATDSSIPATFSYYDQLLVAVILSAQTTDKQVNKVTATLFQTIKQPEDVLKLGHPAFEQAIKSIGLYKGKAKN